MMRYAKAGLGVAIGALIYGMFIKNMLDRVV